MPYRFYEVDISFKQRSGATIPVSSKSLEEVHNIIADLFSDYEDLQVEEVRPVPTPDEQRQEFSAQLNEAAPTVN